MQARVETQSCLDVSIQKWNWKSIWSMLTRHDTIGLQSFTCAFVEWIGYWWFPPVNCLQLLWKTTDNRKDHFTSNRSFFFVSTIHQKCFLKINFWCVSPFLSSFHAQSSEEKVFKRSFSDLFPLILTKSLMNHRIFQKVEEKVTENALKNFHLWMTFSSLFSPSCESADENCYINCAIGNFFVKTN